jgi:hypothetical protein
MAKDERVAQYLKQWRHNRQFAKQIDSTFRDWQVNAVFYTALHAINAAAASLGIDVTDHTTRNNAVQTNESFAAVRSQYMNLYRICRVTRYDADPDLWLPEKYLTINDLVDDLLKPIENGLTALVGQIKHEPLKLKE